MEKDHFSREWDDAPMPHSVFFTKQGHAIHGTDHVRNLGRPASHGCVRLERPNAAALFSLVKREGMANVRVVLSGEVPAASDPGVARRAPGYREQPGYVGQGYSGQGYSNQDYYDVTSPPRAYRDDRGIPDRAARRLLDAAARRFARVLRPRADGPAAASAILPAASAGLVSGDERARGSRQGMSGSVTSTGPKSRARLM